MSDPRADRVAHLIDLGRHPEARELVCSLLGQEPDDVMLHGLHAQTLLGLDDLPGALAAGNHVVGLAPDDEWGHRICSIVLDRMGRHDEATAAAANAVRRGPDRWQTHLQYALSAVDARGRLGDARAAAERAVSLGPNEPSTHFVVGLVAQRRNDVELARAAYQRTLALDPDHPTARNNLTVLEGGVRLSRAAQGFAQALRHAPDSPELRQNVDGLAARFVRRVYGASLIALLIGLVASLAGSEKGAVTPVTVATALVVLVGVTAYTWSLARAVPLGIRRYAVPRLYRSAYLLANVVLALAMLCLALITCLVPGGALVGLAALPVLGFANVGILVWTVARRTR